MFDVCLLLGGGDGVASDVKKLCDLSYIDALYLPHVASLSQWRLGCNKPLSNGNWDLRFAIEGVFYNLAFIHLNCH